MIISTLQYWKVSIGKVRIKSVRVPPTNCVLQRLQRQFTLDCFRHFKFTWIELTVYLSDGIYILLAIGFIRSRFFDPIHMTYHAINIIFRALEYRIILPKEPKKYNAWNHKFPEFQCVHKMIDFPRLLPLSWNDSGRLKMNEHDDKGKECRILWYYAHRKYVYWDC